MLETLLTKIGLPVLVQLVASALAGLDSPVAQGAARALTEVDKAIAQGQITQAQIEDAHRHAEKMAEIENRALNGAYAEINQSLRAEIASEDRYVRRMRPTFGYLMALTWALQMGGLAYVIIFQTEKAPFILNAMGSLSAIWAVGLSVLGIYVYKRSEDKKLDAGPEIIAWNGPRP